MISECAIGMATTPLVGDERGTKTDEKGGVQLFGTCAPPSFDSGHG